MVVTIKVTNATDMEMAWINNALSHPEGEWNWGRLKFKKTQRKLIITQAVSATMPDKYGRRTLGGKS